jgi:hypothetical protein
VVVCTAGVVCTGGAVDCAGGAELCAGAEDWTCGVLVTCGADATVPDEAPVAGVDAGVWCGLGFLAGARSAGIAPALLSAVIDAWLPPPDTAGARVPVAVGLDVDLTAEPMANAATSPTTSAAASISQRFLTSPAVCVDATVATSPLDNTVLSIFVVPPMRFARQL